MTSVHLQSFPMAHQPVVPGPPPLGLPWAQAEAQACHLHQVGRFARAERSAAKSRAALEAPAFLSAEQARLPAAHASLCAEAEHWWQALAANDEETVCEAVNTAFSDNPAAGCAVGVDGSVLLVVMRQTATSPISPRPPDPTARQPHREPPTSLIPGQTVVLPEVAWQGMLIAFTFAGADADLTLFQTGTDGRVSDDQDFVFYNQPSAANGAARLLGKHDEGPHVTEKAAVHLTALPEHVQRVETGHRPAVGFCVRPMLPPPGTAARLAGATQRRTGPPYTWVMECPACPTPPTSRGNLEGLVLGRQHSHARTDYKLVQLPVTGYRLVIATRLKAFISVASQATAET
ncbi:TerD family protein [Streptomyces sp. NBC_01763]|uniref:TerD family protein n=1 Tax=Streptomyces sp. NBC_01763 TaxID=2975934 RepID=UPI002DDC2DD9|nr:TerD family protein [Streptomyces sp. NBC_01763]WSC41125.1 TerD family protein [Streptomyces sp. NBC_01763]